MMYTPTFLFGAIMDKLFTEVNAACKMQTRKQGSLQIPQCYNVTYTYEIHSSLLVCLVALTGI
jgi:hypothetical protein